jgi:GTP cyclohydrolase IA
VVDEQKIQAAVKNILEAVNEDVGREGLLETPSRVAKMYAEVFSGLSLDPAEELQVMFSEDFQEMVMVKDITFYSMCEHHLLPFFGKAHVIYIPQHGKITGISKLARVVEIYARRPQLQERLTNQVADLIMERLNPKGVMVVVEAEHLCMSMRGVVKPGTTVITTAMRGIYEADASAQAGAYALLNR